MSVKYVMAVIGKYFVNPISVYDSEKRANDIYNKCTKEDVIDKTANFYLFEITVDDSCEDLTITRLIPIKWIINDESIYENVYDIFGILKVKGKYTGNFKEEKNAPFCFKFGGLDKTTGLKLEPLNKIPSNDDSNTKEEEILSVNTSNVKIEDNKEDEPDDTPTMADFFEKIKEGRDIKDSFEDVFMVIAKSGVSSYSKLETYVNLIDILFYEYRYNDKKEYEEIIKKALLYAKNCDRR